VNFYLKSLMIITDQEPLGLNDVGDATMKYQISIISLTILVVNLFPGF